MSGACGNPWESPTKDAEKSSSQVKWWFYFVQMIGFGDFRRYFFGGGELSIVSKGEIIIKTYRS
jgi:hypothetical protein